MSPFPFGSDHGTHSGRTVDLNAPTGQKIAPGAVAVPGARHGVLLDPAHHPVVRQPPGDSLPGLPNPGAQKNTLPTHTHPAVTGRTVQAPRSTQADASRFVTGTVLAVGGGFTACSGV